MKYTDISLYCGGFYLNLFPLSPYHESFFKTCRKYVGWSPDAQQTANSVQIALRFRQIYERPRLFNFVTSEGAYHTICIFNVRSEQCVYVKTGRRLRVLSCSGTGFLMKMVQLRLFIHFYDSIRYNTIDKHRPRLTLTHRNLRNNA